ncbi:uncharacterized protein LOC106169574 isoform X1 [Lingula anatina]|uniref:Uncharacterized protein LOC106169574 isoform X1 n=1 Tax=Lingula anatina TaxID=7574 RepID=A0A1S3J2P6_LINAN|nr:uncharacterized protein LOC106169574 isoform X1 [Lingula anatina]|eukprot:XP_013404523.1 uncharacterized protein LOC106169574 isoform X1 [Lingula anatina]
MSADDSRVPSENRDKMPWTDAKPVGWGGGSFWETSRSVSRDHRAAIFGSTSGPRGFYVIHPDWTSESLYLSKPLYTARSRSAWGWERPKTHKNINGVQSYVMPKTPRVPKESLRSTRMTKGDLESLRSYSR